MAAYELDHPGLGQEQLAQEIHARVLKHRTVEAIKGHCKTSASYQQRQESLASSRLAPLNTTEINGRALRSRDERGLYRAPSVSGESDISGASEGSDYEDAPAVSSNSDSEDADENGRDIELVRQQAGPTTLLRAEPGRRARRQPEGLAPIPEAERETLEAAVRRLSQKLGIAIPVDRLDVKSKLDEWVPLKQLRQQRQRPAQNRRNGKNARSPPVAVRERELKRRRYAVFQNSWDKDRGRVVKKILEGEDLLAAPVRPEGTHAFWHGLFTRPSPEDRRNPAPMREVVEEAFAAITVEKLKIALESTRRTTAPGHDGRTLSDLKALGPDKLAWVANSCLWMGALPEEWMTGRTTLLPKLSRPERPGDFRPITVTPLITRTIHKVLAKRLSTLAPLPIRQKGFKQEEGCTANLTLLRALVKRAKTTPASLYVAWVDFKKAFDSVGHPSLVAACKR